MSGVAIHASSWGAALVRISPYTFSAIGIAISIGVSVLGAAWYKSFFLLPIDLRNHHAYENYFALSLYGLGEFTLPEVV